MNNKWDRIILLVIIFSFISLGVSAKSNSQKLLNNAPSKKNYPQAGGIYLTDQTIIDHTGKQSQIRRRKVIKVFNKRGVKEYGEFKIRFNKSNERVKIIEVKTIKVDGSIIKPKEKAINEITPPEAANASIYSDARIKVVSMSGVEPGSIVVCEYLKTKQEYTIQDEFWSYQSFQATDPIKEKSLVLKAPVDKKINYKVRNAELEPTIEKKDNSKTYTWFKTDIPAIIPENNMPSLMNIVPVVQISTLDSWGQVSKWYQSLINEQYQVNDRLRTKIKELTKEDNSRQEKIKSLYNYVTSQIRYIGLQFGESGYQPYSAVETFRNKYGVCKEKATLLIAMLREIGVKAQPVLIRRGSATIDLDIVSPAIFNHLIVYLPERDSYLDPTSSGTMYGVLPGDQGKNVLLPEIDKLAKTPVMEPKENRAFVKQEVKLDKTGDAQVKYQEGYTGVYGYIYKRGYQKYTPQQRQQIIKRGVNKGFSNVQIKGVELNGIESLATIFKIEISELNVTKYGQKMGNIISFKPLRYSLGLSKLVATQKREYPLYLSFKRQITREIELELPTGYQINYLPENINFSNEIGKVKFVCKKQDRKIKINLNLDIKQQVVESKDYQAARTLFNKAAGAIKTQIMIQR